MTTISPNSTPGVLLVGHGTRDVRGQREFLDGAELLQSLLPEMAVEPCFLELAEPNISAGAARLAARGSREWVVAPALLFAAAHAKRDIPEAVAAAIEERQLGQITWNMAEPLACHEKLLKLSAERFHAALPANTRVEETQLVMVGRGTSDAEAINEMCRFTELRTKLTPVAEHQTAFLTGAAPSLDAALEAAANSAHTNIVVQPHLLWRGQLVEDIAAAVARWQTTPEGRRKRWSVVEHLGPHLAVAQALAARVTSVYISVT